MTRRERLLEKVRMAGREGQERQALVLLMESGVDYWSWRKAYKQGMKERERKE